MYSRRRNALSGERIEIDVMNMMLDMANVIVEKGEGMPYEDFSEFVMGQLSIDPGFDAEFYEKARKADLSQKLYEHMDEVYHRRMDNLVAKAWPLLKTIYEKQGHLYTDQMIRIPVTDGRRVIGFPVNLEKVYETEGRELAKVLSKTLILIQIDENWKQHLRDMDDLRQSVQNAAYEQKDPLVVYKLESYNLFASMLEKLNKDVLSFLLRADLYARTEQPQRMAQPRQMQQLQTNRNNLSTNGEQKSNTPVVADKKIGRNDPCPCGSGKKYKNCHGKGLV